MVVFSVYTFVETKRKNMNNKSTKLDTSKKLDNMKKLAVDYYGSVSNNNVLSARKSGKFENSIVLRVYNPTFESIGNVWICFNFEEREMYLCSEIGTHGQRSF